MYFDSSLSYTKANIDYDNITDLLKNNLIKNNEKLTKIRVYFFKDILQFEHINNELNLIKNELEKIPDVEIESKQVDEIFKLNGKYCIRLYYGEYARLPMSAYAVMDLLKNKDRLSEIIKNYKDFFTAYNVTDNYLKGLKLRTTILDSI